MYEPRLAACPVRWRCRLRGVRVRVIVPSWCLCRGTLHLATSRSASGEWPSPDLGMPDAYNLCAPQGFEEYLVTKGWRYVTSEILLQLPILSQRTAAWVGFLRMKSGC